MVTYLELRNASDRTWWTTTQLPSLCVADEREEDRSGNKIKRQLFKFCSWWSWWSRLVSAPAHARFPSVSLSFITLALLQKKFNFKIPHHCCLFGGIKIYYKPYIRCQIRTQQQLSSFLCAPREKKWSDCPQSVIFPWPSRWIWDR